MNAPFRIAASPYARRLARERGIVLETVAGTGPGGRIVAADIEVHRAPLPAAPHSGMVQVLTAASAFATIVDLGKARALAAEFAAAQVGLTLDDLLIRSAGCALNDVEGARRVVGADGVIGAGPNAIAWEAGSGEGRRFITLADVFNGGVGALVARRFAALAEPAGAGGAATLSMRRMTQSGIRPVAMPLLAGAAMRLVISAGEDSGEAECLLSFDARAIDENDAAAFLGRFRDNLELPVRMLA